MIEGSPVLDLEQRPLEKKNGTRRSGVKQLNIEIKNGHILFVEGHPVEQDREVAEISIQRESTAISSTPHSPFFSRGC